MVILASFNPKSRGCRPPFVMYVPSGSSFQETDDRPMRRKSSNRISHIADL
jgi:hypothetical protein